MCDNRSPALVELRMDFDSTFGLAEEFYTPEFVFTRELAAPRDMVFKAFTEADWLMRWWGPWGFTILYAKVDLRPGGEFHYGMRAPNGGEMWGRWVLREIVAPERLVFVASFSDAAGGITRNPYAPDWPQEMLCTTKFEELAGGTLLCVGAVPLNATMAQRTAFEDGYDSLHQGFKGTLDQLASYLASQVSK
jgi:uncharacterized protein YndB with AHSA1/START domain